MILGSIFLIILYLVFRYIIAWITYFNNLDPRLGDSTWRFTYDYPVAGERDISDLDDKDFVRLRRKKNKIVLLIWDIKLKHIQELQSVLKKLAHLWKVKALIEIIFLQSNLLKEKDTTEVLTSYPGPYSRWLLH